MMHYSPASFLRIFKLGFQSHWEIVLESMLTSMAIRVVEFSNGGTKLEIHVPKNQHIQRKLLNFENWVNGEVSKIGHHFSE